MFTNYFLKNRNYFFIFLVFYLFFCFLTFRQYGICGDEQDSYAGGAILLKYFKGHNLEALKNDFLAHNYPFEALLLKLSMSKGVDFDRLHLLNLLFASGVFWMMYELLYLSFGDGRWALTGPVALFLTSRFLGDIPANPKDASFAVFYFFCLGAMILKEKWFPGRFWRIFGLGILFGFASSHRIVGLTLFPVYGLFRLLEGGLIEKEWTDVKKIREWFFKEVLEWAAVFVVSQLTLCALWPYIGVDYFHHFAEVLTSSRRFVWGGTILFAGKIIDPNHHFYWSYLAVWIAITTPIFLLLSFIFSLFRWNFLWKKKVYSLMVLAFAVNLVLYFLLKPVIYGALRHYLFLLPILVFLSCSGLIHFFTILKRGPIRWAALAFVSLNVFFVVFHLVRLFPYDYLYFNEFVGGIRGAYGKYEMDYNGKSLREATLWLKENEIKNPNKDYKIKMDGGTLLATYYFSGNMHGYANIKDGDADFCYVLNGATGYALPSSGKVIHVVEREGVPLTAILKINEQSEK